MILSKDNLQYIDDSYVSKPAVSLLDLPVKILQFGTGVLLRGLPDYVIDKANRKGIFNGRIAIVKSTDKGDTTAFQQQDNLFTILIKGIENGNIKQEQVICSSIARVLSANEDWDAVLSEAENADLKIIISNTTEIGIQFKAESVFSSPPQSFPGKLLALLYRRFNHFNGALNIGLIIIPTELLPENGAILKQVINQLVEFNQLSEDFITWLNEANRFCNSLVDRIVPGSPSHEDQLRFQKKAGYTDSLLISSEPYLLWAIEGDEEVKRVLSFEKAHEGVLVSPDITAYSELKLRLLNGTHTLGCAVALLAGFETVRSAVEDKNFLRFLHNVLSEITLSIPYELAENEAEAFAGKVLDRFRNPFIRHLWSSISQKYTAKLQTRVLPLLSRFYKRFNKPPAAMAMGFAAYIVFMRGANNTSGVTSADDERVRAADEKNAARFNAAWLREKPAEIANEILRDNIIWGADLTVFPGFTDAVQLNIDGILSDNMYNCLINYNK
jgi:tagaturonate reductase